MKYIFFLFMCKLFTQVVKHLKFINLSYPHRSPWLRHGYYLIQMSHSYFTEIVRLPWISLRANRDSPSCRFRELKCNFQPYKTIALIILLDISCIWKLNKTYGYLHNRSRQPAANPFAYPAISAQPYMRLLNRNPVKMRKKEDLYAHLSRTYYLVFTLYEV